MSRKYTSIGNAAKSLGVSISTLRRWDKNGRLVAERTPSGHRMYSIPAISSFNPLTKTHNAAELPTIAYARVSSHDQKLDLERQVKVLEMFCSSHRWKYRVIQDLGSGMNYLMRKAVADAMVA